MRKLKEIFINTFCSYLAIELVEEIIEEIITFEISSLILKAFATIGVVLTTTTGKVMIKTLVRKITYKEGNDKVEKLKQLFKWIYSNKKTISGYITSIGSAVVASLGGTGVIDVNQIAPLMIGGFNITPILFYAVLLVVSLIGVSGKGFETVKQFFARKSEEKAEKAEKLAEKTAEKELKNEEKAKNQTEAQKVKEAEKQAIEQKQKEEKEKAEAEFRAKVEAYKKDIQNKKLEQEKSTDTTSNT